MQFDEKTAHLEIIVSDVEEDLVVEVLPRCLVICAGRQLAHALLDGVQEGLEDGFVLDGALQVVEDGVDMLLVVLDLEVLHPVVGVDGRQGAEDGPGQPDDPVGGRRLHHGEFFRRVLGEERVGLLDQALRDEPEQGLELVGQGGSHPEHCRHGLAAALVVGHRGVTEQPIGKDWNIVSFIKCREKTTFLIEVI